MSSSFRSLCVGAAVAKNSNQAGCGFPCMVAFLLFVDERDDAQIQLHTHDESRCTDHIDKTSLGKDGMPLVVVRN